MSRLTQVELDKIRQRVEDTSYEKAYVKGDPWKGYEVKDEGNGLVVAEASTESDAEFIAAAREDVPKLLADIYRLQNELKLEKSAREYHELQHARLKGVNADD